ncbi:MAG: nitrous oxide-stimulated promoter family protein [Bacteroidales bacterium]|nr:nitrous oxide-stimulated promoter family protein [Bacteroidales bacterium]
MLKKLRENYIEIEKQTVSAMITVYCRGHGHELPCAECEALREYALKRLDKCPYGNEKPACKDCPIHCYKPAMREKIKQVMRYSGPRMLWKYPWLSVSHKISQLINKPKSTIGL